MDSLCNIISNPCFSEIQKWIDVFVNFLVAIGTFFAVVVAVVGGHRIRYWLFKPKLKIEIEQSKLNIQRFYQDGTEVRCYYLKLKNYRNRLEKNVRVLLKGYAEKDNTGTFKFFSYPLPLQLVWSPRESTPTLVDLNKEKIIDFLELKNENNLFILRPILYNAPFDFNEKIQQGKCIRFEVAVVADYVECSQIIEINFNNDASHNSIGDVGKDIVIKEVDN